MLTAGGHAASSLLWATTLLAATHPVGSTRFPWLYTGNTLALPVVLFAVEGHVAGGAAPGERQPTP